MGVADPAALRGGVCPGFGLLWATCFLEVWNATRAATESPGEWLDRHDGVWQVVLPKDDVNAILAVKDDNLTPVAAHLDAAISSSMTGERIFSFALQNVMAYRIATTCTKELEKLASKEEVTKLDVIASHNRCCDVIQALPHLDTLCERREIQIAYRSLKFGVHIKSWHEEVQARIYACIRGWAAELDLVKQVGGENHVCTKTEELVVKKLDRSLLANIKAARAFIETISGIATGTSIKSGEQLQASWVGGVWKVECSSSQHPRKLGKIALSLTGREGVGVVADTVLDGDLVSVRLSLEPGHISKFGPDACQN